MRSVIFLLMFSVNLFATNLSFEFEPMPGQCFPSDPGSKVYIREKKTLLYVQRSFRCDYICIDQNQKEYLIQATKTEKDWFEASGKKFVCEGYKETMIWVDTPQDRNSWGYWKLNQITPFYPENRDLPELKQWANNL